MPIVAAALLAESGSTQNQTPNPILLGVATFVTLLVVLFLVTRLNKDR